jgi:hypothetical protein
MNLMHLKSSCVAALVLISVGGVTAQKKAAAPASAKVTAKVVSSPTCGCCSIWVKHLESAGFAVERELREDLEAAPVRKRVPAQLKSCHTAQVGKYLVEGHVPADLVQRLLKEQPAGVLGIAVPGMPIGSPGMEGPNPRPYSVIAFKADGTTYEFARR